jgi:hypothetical protein
MKKMDWHLAQVSGASALLEVGHKPIQSISFANVRDRVKKHRDGLEWRRCDDCKRTRWCFWPVRDAETGENVAVCPKCWGRKS